MKWVDLAFGRATQTERTEAILSSTSLATRDAYALSIEERRETQTKLEHQLARSLAAYVALRRDEPISKVLDDLFSLEMKAAQFLGSALPALVSRDLTGALAGVMQCIPLSTKGIARPERDVTPTQLTGKVSPKKRVQRKKKTTKKQMKAAKKPMKRSKKKGRALKDNP